MKARQLLEFMIRESRLDLERPVWLQDPAGQWAIKEFWVGDDGCLYLSEYDKDALEDLCGPRS